MRKWHLKILFVFLSILSVFSYIEAKDYKVTATGGLFMRSKPNTSGSKVVLIKYLEIVERIDDKNYKGSGCNSSWYKIKYKGKTGYSCSNYLSEIIINPDVPVIVDEKAWLEFFNKQNFPNDYKTKLLEIHKKYPAWVFVRQDTDKNWKSSLNFQNQKGRSAIYYTFGPGYRSLDDYSYNYEKDTWKFLDADFYYANEETIAHYLDPRNYLDERLIFAFETLTYNENFNNEEALKQHLYPHLKKYAKHFLDAGKIHNLSPFFLINKSKVEVGRDPTNVVISGKAGIREDGVDYNGYYNFYNIGASSSTAPRTNALRYAKARGWKDDNKGFQVTGPKLAIIGGAEFLGNGYIKKNQDTNYFQKFNVAKNKLSSDSHQYMTDITGARTLAIQQHNIYRDTNLLQMSLVFKIPVFEGMPKNVSKAPNPKHPNNHLKEIKINGKLINNFSHDQFIYNLEYKKLNKIKIDATPIIKGVKVTNTGEHKLYNGNNKIILKSNGLNGKTQDYIINIKITEGEDEVPDPGFEIDIIKEINNSNYNLKDDVITNIGENYKIDSFKKSFKNILITVRSSDNSIKTKGFIGTGDKIEFKTKDETKTFTALIYGDNSGDGRITALDLLRVQKDILKSNKLTGINKKASDLNNNGKIDLVDLLRTQKHILGKYSISQK